ncbi:homeodomain mating type protein alpha2 KNAG_0C00160 [Huiozyma naganishii CBS 8797]|uniref:Homeobox domain-containing protein n=1 Tax=Huiozyma naganishii (strain ATCC MYA-139 / BCRC 22969 / CBS 8797 / KCTC 17520 / NBRC 10181 / NCYC 3082 / Yp74L-3) TaxID=1071383 RepID=J7S5G3_HUIN7|nr:hypothetical protein KNAG_0C00160 [Kazachstania naganishii CBS 8797]CCK69131.1 hypothetical protein KNAG_0C00160 [Kazachstania naganishii CBS 8797]
MNRIEIQDLLNNQDCSSLDKDFKNINSQLLEICSNFPKELLSNHGELQMQLQGILLFLTKLVGKNDLSVTLKNEARMTYQFSKIIASLLKSFEDFFFERKEYNDPATSENEFVFSVVTQDMMNKRKESMRPCRGHRFSSNSTETLEDWYKKHHEKPYLDKRSLHELEFKTKLSKMQIRNWVSNRRRKEKSIHVSPVIQDLLQE